LKSKKHLYLLLLWGVLCYSYGTVKAETSKQGLYSYKLSTPNEPYTLAYDQHNKRYLVLKQEKFYFLIDDSKGWKEKAYDLNEFDPDLDLRQLVVLYNKERVLLVLQSGGYVYEMVHDSIKKLDKSSNFRTQYGSVKFIANDTLVSYGGYGHWTLQPFFTYFDPKSGEWEMWEIASDNPLPPSRTNPMGYFNPLTGDFYLLGGYTTRYKAQLPRQDIRLDDVWKINITKRRWEKLGNVQRDLAGFYLSPIIIGDQVLCYDADKDRIAHIFDFQKNKLSNYELTEGMLIDFHNKVSPAIDKVNQDVLYATLPFPYSSGREQIIVAPLKTLLESTHSTTKIYSKSWPLKFIITLIVLISLSLFYVLRLAKRLSKLSQKADFYLKEGILKYKNVKINLDHIEQKLLKELASDSKYHNLVDLFGSTSIEINSMDSIYKQRKKIFKSINDKMNFITKGEKELIISRKSPTDNRMIEVKINDELIRIFP
jgi:Galactose oxidase, central domain